MLTKQEQLNFNNELNQATDYVAEYDVHLNNHMSGHYKHTIRKGFLILICVTSLMLLLV